MNWSGETISLLDYLSKNGLKPKFLMVVLIFVSITLLPGALFVTFAYREYNKIQSKAYDLQSTALNEAGKYMQSMQETVGDIKTIQNTILTIQRESAKNSHERHLYVDAILDDMQEKVDLHHSILVYYSIIPMYKEGDKTVISTPEHRKKIYTELDIDPDWIDKIRFHSAINERPEK